VEVVSRDPAAVEQRVAVDRIVAATGYRPDHGIALPPAMLVAGGSPGHDDFDVHNPTATGGIRVVGTARVRLAVMV
jgi:hypothetical protein